jgi:membrane protein DedA with SNARE-associated domain
LSGLTGGRVLVDRFGRCVVTHDDLDRVESWFKEQGDPVVLFERVVPVVRTIISLPAGLAEINVAKFVGFTTSAAAWVALLSSIGYALGTSWESITNGYCYNTYVVAVLDTTAVATLVVHRICAFRRVRIAERTRARTRQDATPRSHQAAPRSR